MNLSVETEIWGRTERNSRVKERKKIFEPIGVACVSWRLRVFTAVEYSALVRSEQRAASNYGFRTNVWCAKAVSRRLPSTADDRIRPPTTASPLPSPTAYGGTSIASPPPSPTVYGRTSTASPPPSPTAYGRTSTASPPPSPTACGRTNLAKNVVLDKQDEEHHMNLEQVMAPIIWPYDRSEYIVQERKNHSDGDSQKIASTTHEKEKLYANTSEALDNSVEEARRLPSIKLRDNGEGSSESDGETGKARFRLLTDLLSGQVNIEKEMI
nr:uncharacterized protein LOC109178709 [Ipomoea batatas]